MAVALEKIERIVEGDVELQQGRLRIGRREFAIRDGIVRFREGDGYSDSFALQWARFRTEQIDAVNGTTMTRRRFDETGWDPRDLADKLVLEGGCGAGRFTRLLAESGADLVTFDYSSAVEVCADNNRGFMNVLFCQSDILDMPFRPGAFDYVFCHGVLQHTPSPERSFYALERMVRPGGRISVDVYKRDRTIRPWKSKYLWRPITTRVEQLRLLEFLEWFIPKWLPIDTFIKRIPILGPILGSVVPCWNYFYTDLSHEQKVRWAVMDTFDALAPKHDHPVRLEEVRRWFLNRGYTDFEVRPGGNGVVGNGVKPQGGHARRVSEVRS